jgi:hypothetical protein
MGLFSSALLLSYPILLSSLKKPACFSEDRLTSMDYPRQNPVVEKELGRVLSIADGALWSKCSK